MAFFDEIGKKITNVSKDATQKAKDLTEITKLNMQNSKEEDNIRNVYGQMGKMYFELFADSPDERFAGFCNSIKESLKKIEDNKIQIQKIKGIKKCPKCGAEINDSSAFCGVCGAKANSIEESSPGDLNLNNCSKCGKPFSEDTVFCTNCGNKVR